MGIATKPAYSSLYSGAVWDNPGFIDVAEDQARHATAPTAFEYEPGEVVRVEPRMLAMWLSSVSGIRNDDETKTTHKLHGAPRVPTIAVYHRL